MFHTSIQTIIFSFNRAMQLDALLQSIQDFDRSRLLNVSVVYGFTEDKYEEGYNILINKYSSVSWNKETRRVRSIFPRFWVYWHNLYWWIKYKHMRFEKGNFRELINHSLDKASDEYVMFLTDDSLFIKDIDINQDCLALIDEKPTEYCFSLRHGLNLNGANVNFNGKFAEWDIYKQQMRSHWGYPFSVDGHIYKRDVVREIARRILFNNPNTFEGNMASYVRECKYFRYNTCGSFNSLVGFELNRVQNVSDNHHLGIDEHRLNDLFLTGFKIRYDFDSENIRDFRPEILGVNVVRGDDVIHIY